jgi:hypothetical protein
MSFKATVWAWAQRDLTAQEKLVLLALADRHNADSNECWPSKTKLSEDTGISMATIKRSINSLIEKGLISKEERTSSSGRSISNVYRIHFSVVDEGKGSTLNPPGDHTEPPEGLTLSPKSVTYNQSTEPKIQNPTSGINSKKEFWDTAIGTMAALNVAESTAKGIIGRALALAQGDFSAVMKLLDAALMANPKNPAAYILGALQKGSVSPKLKITPEMQKINDEYMEKYKDHYNGTHNTTGSIGSDNGPVQPQPHAEPNDLSGPPLESFDELPAGGVNQAGGPARGYLDSLQVSADNSGSRRSGRKINEKAF